MKAFRQFFTSLRVLASARRERLGVYRHLARRPQLLLGTLLFETGVMLAARVDPKLKLLAETKVAAIVACEYCLDIGAALARHEGVTEQQLRDIHRYHDSDAYSETEKLVIEFAEAATRVPTTIDSRLRARLDDEFSPAQLAELAGIIAWENTRARLNQALGVRPSGFADGLVCAVPESAA